MVAVVGGAVAALVLVFAFSGIGAKELSVVDEATVDKARSEWDSLNITDYRIKVEVVGPNPGVYEVDVAGGVPVTSTFKGKPLTDDRTKGTWTVPGMFRTIDLDLYYRSQNDRPDDRLLVKAAFDPEYHFPARFQRHDFDARTSVTWEVLEFETRQKTTSTNKPPTVEQLDSASLESEPPVQLDP